MDNAANGARGLRATPSQKLFGLLCDRYGLDGVDSARDLGGSSNLNLFVSGGGVGYVVRVYRPYVSASRLADLQRVRRTLAEAGVPCSHVIPTRDGEPWAPFDGRLVEVERYVEHDAKMDSWARLEIGLAWLGRIHSLLRAVEVGPEGKTPLFSNYVAPYEALDWTRQGAQRIRGWQPSAAELRLVEAAEELASLVGDAERDFASSVQRQLVHGDFWDNNVLFQNQRVVLVTDFDFMGERSRIDDLALTLYFTNSTFSEDPVSAQRIVRLCRLVEAYNGGCDNPLTSAERAMLPWALVRQPLWAVGRWVALLDDEERARSLVSAMYGDVEWALQVAREIERWQTAFA